MIEYPSIDDLIADRKRRLDRWQGWRRRVGDIRNLVANRWAAVFQRDFDPGDVAMVGNLFRVSVEDGGRLFAEQQPQERCDPENLRGEKRAELREQAVIAYSNISRLWDDAEFYGQDMIAAGLTGIRVWPNFRAPIERRFPEFERLDPEMLLPEPRWRPDRPSDHVMVSTIETVDRLSRQYPEPLAALMEEIKKTVEDRATNYALAGQLPDAVAAVKPAELTQIDYYCRDYIVRAAMHDAANGKTYGRVLLTMENPTGLCPVQLSARRAWSTEPLGQLDDAKGPLQARNRYLHLLLAYFVKMVYGGRLAWNVQNPTASGPGTTYLALGPDAKMENVAPEQPSFEVNAVLSLLDDEARTSMVRPRSREGDVQLNKASAAYLSRAQGELRSVTASLQDTFARTKERANEVAMAQDEVWCNATKEITGMARGRRFRATYNPKKDIRGDYSNRVTYGANAGLDEPTANVIRLQKLDKGVLSRESAMEQDPDIEDVPVELQKLRLQVLEDSILQGLLLPTTTLQQRVLVANAIARGMQVEDLVQFVAPAEPATPPLPALGPGAESGGAGEPPPGFGPPGMAVQGPLPPMAALQGAQPAPAPAGRRR